MNCLLLGAGASYGYGIKDDTTLSDIFQPPTTRYIIHRGIMTGMLNRETYPILYETLQELTDEKKDLRSVPNKLKFDIEHLLSWILDKRSGVCETWSILLGECFYFIYELLRLSEILYSPRLFEDNYRRLARKYPKNKFSVVSLNYDVLFESALDYEGLKPAYGLNTSSNLKGIPFAKIHGSINWLYPRPDLGGLQGIFSGDARHNSMKTITGSTFDQQIIPIHPTKVKNLLHTLFPIFGMKRFGVKTDWIPAINPPFGKYKKDRYNQINNVRELAKRQFSRATELTIIGCSLRDEDEVLASMLKENLQDDIHVNIVVPSGDLAIKAKIDNWVANPTFNNSHDYFHEYVDSI